MRSKKHYPNDPISSQISRAPYNFILGSAGSAGICWSVSGMICFIFWVRLHWKQKFMPDGMICQIVWSLKFWEPTIIGKEIQATKSGKKETNGKRPSAKVG